MSAPLIFNGRRAKMLTQDGILRADGSIIDNNGVPNLIKNGHAEINVTGWTVSKNTSAASRPDSGFITSGTNITWTRNTTNPIDGQADFLYTKDAANRQGEQVYCGFTVAKKHRAKVLQIEVDYLVNSGTFSAGSSSTDSDVILYIYDVTNSTFIEPSSFKFLSNSSTIADKFIANFQTSATGSSYRILFHQATTSTSAFAVQFKDVSIKPCNYVYGTPITDWQSYTPTLSNLGTTTNVNGAYRRVGSNLEGKVTFTAGTGTGSTATIGLPSGLAMPSAPAGFRASVNNIVGDVANGGAGSGVDIVVLANPSSSTTTLTIGIRVAATLDNLTSRAGSDLSSTYFDLRFSVPISGWSSSTQVSDGYDGRVIGLKVNSTGTTGTLNTSDNVVKHAATTINDTTVSYSASTGLWTCPRSDWYIVSGSYVISHTTASGYISASIGVNGTIVVEDYKYVNGTADSQQSVQSQAIYITAGQTVGLYSKTNLTTPAFTAASKNNWFSIIAAKSPQTMSATEVVAAQYLTTETTSLTNGSTTVLGTTSTKDFDTHNAVSAGVFTVPYSGFYKVSGGASLSAGATYGIVNMYFQKNGTTKITASRTYNNSTSVIIPVSGSAIINANAGDTLRVQIQQQNAASGTYSLSGGNTDAQTNGQYISFERIK